jgi:hypothetical protein
LLGGLVGGSRLGRFGVAFWGPRGDLEAQEQLWEASSALPARPAPRPAFAVELYDSSGGPIGTKAKRRDGATPCGRVPGVAGGRGLGGWVGGRPCGLKPSADGALLGGPQDHAPRPKAPRGPNSSLGPHTKAGPKPGRVPGPQTKQGPQPGEGAPARLQVHHRGLHRGEGLAEALEGEGLGRNVKRVPFRFEGEVRWLFKSGLGVAF